MFLQTIEWFFHYYYELTWESSYESSDYVKLLYLHELIYGVNYNKSSKRLKIVKALINNHQLTNNTANTWLNHLWLLHWFRNQTLQQENIKLQIHKAFLYNKHFEYCIHKNDRKTESKSEIQQVQQNYYSELFNY